jgi:hypothetical protein
VTVKPVNRVINTHTHYDHTEGNPDFPATVEVVTHENTAKMMPEMKPPYGVTLTDRNVFKDSKGRGLPKRTFTDEMTIGRGNDRIVVVSVAPDVQIGTPSHAPYARNPPLTPRAWHYALVVQGSRDCTSTAPARAVVGATTYRAPRLDGHQAASQPP